MVKAAMDSGELLYEPRGRVRYSRSDWVDDWDKKRANQPKTSAARIHPALADFI